MWGHFGIVSSLLGIGLTTRASRLHIFGESYRHTSNSRQRSTRCKTITSSTCIYPTGAEKAFEMPTSIRLRPARRLRSLRFPNNTSIFCHCEYATAAIASATTPAPSIAQMTAAIPSLNRSWAPTQPPSHRAPQLRKSQLIRSYVSLLQSTPLILFFQHNNLKAMEWVGIRKELTIALRKLDETLIAQGRDDAAVGSSVKLQIVHTNMFEQALRITEYYEPAPPPEAPQSISSEKDDPRLTHALSEAAYKAVFDKKYQHPLSPLLIGSLALLTLPTVSPQHVAAALSILSPSPPRFPAPTRRLNPGYHEPSVQEGIRKLMLLGARIDGTVFDNEGTKWVGGIDGGIDGLRAQLVQMLQGFGAGIASTLESASRSLYFTMEGRRSMLEEEANPKDGAADAPKES